MKRRAGKRLIGVMTAGFVLLILILITIGVLQDSSQNKRTYKIIMVPKTIDESNDFWTGLIEEQSWEQKNLAVRSRWSEVIQRMIMKGRTG